MTLLGYARFYQSIHEMLPSDKPDDATIEDDDALDKWYNNYVREQAIKSGRKQEVRGGFKVPEFNNGP